MEKKIFALVLAAMLWGCSYGQNYMENPESFFKDPHFAEYDKARDDLERQYLHKDITYAEYIEGKEQLDKIYAKEVMERNAKITSPE